MASLPLSHRAIHVPIVLVAIAVGLPTIAAAPRPTLGDVLPERGGDAELAVVVREREGGAIPARLRIEGLGLTPDPEALPSGLLLAPQGRRTIALPPGFYRVTASRGPEHSVASADVALEVDSTRELTLELRRVLDPGEHVGCDFHVHAAPSGDSSVTLEDRVASLAAEGVRFAVATDHNHVTDYAPTARALALDEVLATAPGVEVTTWAPEFGHFNAWPLVPDASDARGGAPSYQRTSPRELFAALRGLGEDVVVQINHPRLEPRIGYFEHARFDPTTGASSDDASFDVDAVEVWNGYELASSAALDRNLADWMALLARGHRLVPTGNSDSHDLASHPAGYPRTYVRTGGAVDALSVARAVRAGRVFVTSGPLLDLRVDEGRPGDTIVTRGLVDLKLEVRAPAWMPPSRVEVWMQGALVRSESIDAIESNGARLARFTTSFEVNEPSFVIVVVRGEPVSSPLHEDRKVPVVAFTSPVWITPADRDGPSPSRSGAPCVRVEAPVISPPRAHELVRVRSSGACIVSPMTNDGSVLALLDEADRVAVDGVRALRAAVAHHADWQRRFDDVVNVLELLDEADAHVELAQRAPSPSCAREHAASALALASRAHACAASFGGARHT